jgi:hypothetical protein
MKNKRKEEEEEEKRTSFCLSSLLSFSLLSSVCNVCMCASRREYFRSLCDVRYRIVAVVATTTTTTTTTTTKGGEEDDDDKKEKEYKCTQTR